MGRASTSHVEPFYRALGLRIEALRNEHGMSQAQLGGRLVPPMTRASVAYIEAGRQRVLAHTFVQLAEVFGVGLADLLPAERPGRRESPRPAAATLEDELAEKLGLPRKEISRLAARLETAAGRKKR